MFLTKLFKKKEIIHKYEINNAILTLEKKIKILKRASSNMDTRKKYILQTMEDIIEIFKEIDYEIYKTSYRLKDFDKETYYHMFINLIYEYLNNDKKNL
ncbi:hypothetical protein SAMN02745135_02062 [Caloranaerobacter azorensis DSM 13643]|uniref:Uncharacterized protein n=1 Tax=Caloranaerobacter azorensis DSM 13643 TaxID=1121264 RepID=A0A1M5VQ78_9FIRM|nr:hypothetical protein [Caloranaerobacter azorensis]SHH77416.1 hypothetical protein SAMN02745135_02062 [Caloranaerobacter azorensis DSM 13643]